ncbi:hypothetical protein NWF32_12865 [Pseudomonas qingdaonensis]|nr:hypothetical protein [Pseudomonas qingdaonensis]
MAPASTVALGSIQVGAVMTKITQDQGAAGLTAADTDGENTLALQVVRVLGLMELRADEEGVPTLSQAAQTSRLRLEIDKWGYYETEYADLVDKGYSPPEVVFQALWNGQEIGEPVTKTMVKDPAGLFPLVLEMPQFLLQAEGVARVSYRRWIKYIDNKSTADPQLIRIDRTAPNFQNPCPLLGPDKNVAVIDQAYLDLNDQRAIFFWTDGLMSASMMRYCCSWCQSMKWAAPASRLLYKRLMSPTRCLIPFLPLSQQSA